MHIKFLKFVSRSVLSDDVSFNESCSRTCKIPSYSEGGGEVPEFRFCRRPANMMDFIVFKFM